MAVVGVLTTKLQLESFGFTRGMANAVKSVNAFQKAVRTDLVRSMSVATNEMRSLAARGFGGIVTGVTAALRSVVRFADFIAGRFLVALSRLTTALRSVLKAFAIVAGGVVISLGLLTRAAFKTVDEMAKTARKLGIPIEKMQGLKIAAAEAGIGFLAFTTGLQRAARRIEDALSGIGVGVIPLLALNLNAKELARLSPDRQILKIAEALEKVGKQGQKILIGFGLFDTEGVANILLTAKALREADRFAEKLGINLNKIDTANIEAANDAAGRLKFAFAGVGQVIAGKMSPAIEAFSNLALKKIIEVGGVAELLNTIMAKLGPIVAASIDFVAVAAENALRFISDVSDEASRFLEEFEEGGTLAGDKFFAPLLGIFDSIKLVVQFVNAALLSILQSVSEVAALSESIVSNVLQGKGGLLKDFLLAVVPGAPLIPLLVPEDFKKTLAENDKTRLAALKSIQKDAELARAQFLDTLDKVLSSNLETPTGRIELQFIEPLKEGINKIVPTLKDYSSALSVSTESLADFLKKINESGGATQAALDALNALIEANVRHNNVINEFTETVSVAARKIKELYAGIMVNAVNSASQSLARSFLFAENAFIGLRNVALQAIEDIIAALIRLAAFKFIASLFPGGGVISRAIQAATGGIVGGAQNTAPAPIASRASFGAPGLVPAMAGGGVTVHNNFFGPVSGSEEIKRVATEAVLEAAPALTNAAASEVQKRNERQRRFLQ